MFLIHQIETKYQSLLLGDIAYCIEMLWLSIQIWAYHW